MMAGLTLRDLLVVNMKGSTSVLDITCSSTHFGWCHISVCFRCICVIPCISEAASLRAVPRQPPLYQPPLAHLPAAPARCRPAGQV